MSEKHDHGDLAEKHAGTVPAYESAGLGEHKRDGDFGSDPENLVETKQNALHQDLKGRHMQMIAIGGAIGAGLFVSSGGAFQTGGPASVLLGFMIIGM
jgi:amino acid transporter